MVERKAKLIGSAALTVGMIGAATGIAAAGSGDDSEPAITGEALDRASAAALEHTGGGRVTGTEVGDEEGFYEVEVTLDDGRQVDVHLDRGLTVLDSVSDDDEGDGSEANEG